MQSGIFDTEFSHRNRASCWSVNFLGKLEMSKDDIALLTNSPYARGWLLEVRGEPESDCLDVHGYVSLLNTTIDKMLGKRHE